MTYIMLKSRDCWILGQVIGDDKSQLEGISLTATAWSFPITIIAPAEVKFLLAQVPSKIAEIRGARVETMTNIDVLPMTHLTAFIDTHSVFGLIDSGENNHIVELYQGLVSQVSEARANG